MVKALRKRMPHIGTRKLHHLLEESFRQESIKVGRDKLFYILGYAKLLQKPKRMYAQTTNSKHWMRKYANIIKGLPITRKEQLWVSDITYVRMGKGFCYLSIITDAYSRKIMGSAVSDSLSTEVCLEALKEALRNRTTNNSLIHHSDRGIQYCSREYIQLLKANEVRISMTENGDPYENALAERVNRTIKEEFIGDYLFEDQGLLSAVTAESVRIYNTERPHLSLGMRTPDEVHRATTSNPFRATPSKGYL